MSLFFEIHSGVSTLLSEATKMSVLEINKLNSATGDHRTDILIDRIQKGQELELDDGKKIVADKNHPKVKELIAALRTKDNDEIAKVVKQGTRFAKVIVDKSGQEYGINDLIKAPYFGGGGGGQKADAQSTANAESLQAIAFALSASTKKTTLDPSDFDVSKIKSLEDKLFFIDTKIEDALSKFDGKWVDSTINVVQAYRQHYPVSGMTFHRGSTWANQLLKEFNKLNRQLDKDSKIPHKDKWNPSDIWAVHKSIASEPLPEFTSIIELNGWLEKQFEDGKVIGMSLKFSPSGTKTKVFNDDKEIDDLLTMSIKDLLLNKKGKLFNSNSGHVIYENINQTTIRKQLFESDGGELVVRSFGKGEVSGEIAGKYAAGGKITFNEIKKILKKVAPGKADALKHHNEIFKMIDKDVPKDAEHEYGYTKIIDDILKFAKIVDPEVAGAADNKESRLAFAEASKHKVHHMSSKYQSAQLLSILKGLPKEQSSQFIEMTIAYASSSSELSSVFVKIW